MAAKKTTLIFQFKIILLDSSPKIWRRIQLLETATFWDLHIAIQEAMGWQNYHLHQFELAQPNTLGLLRVGMIELDEEPSPEGGEATSWETLIAAYFTRPGITSTYEYDFGDGWEHEVLLDGIFIKEGNKKYPTCIAGERACPPEDCGGIWGFYNLLEILRTPSHEEYDEMTEWIKDYGTKNQPYGPEFFDSTKVKFSDPKKSLEVALSYLKSL